MEIYFICIKCIYSWYIYDDYLGWNKFQTFSSKTNLTSVFTFHLLGYYIRDIGKECCLGKDDQDQLKCFKDEKECIKVKESSDTLVTEHGCFMWQLDQPVKLASCPDMYATTSYDLQVWNVWEFIQELRIIIFYRDKKWNSRKPLYDLFKLAFSSSYHHLHYRHPHCRYHNPYRHRNSHFVIMKAWIVLQWITKILNE